ncbi:MAG TPA: cell division ATP-binding protein FtsE [Pleomorphomonadaceae bacterium]|nr:cell division ATP-binding protein FtsE [Pleomorphomonadaceae bacterium]
MTRARPAAASLIDDEPLIRLVDVTVTYPNGKEALINVDLEIRRGDFIFLVGPSGAGKSTLIRLLIREQVATTGRVYLAGRDLARVSRSQVHRLRRRIGVVFQDFRLLPNKTVRENVAFALEVTGAPLEEIRRRVPRLLALVGLEDQAQQLPAQLSGGEQQRAAIARALVHDPAILIADEPTGNLDPVTGWEIVQLLLEINALGTTLVVATHNQEIVTALRRRVVALEQGRMVRDEVGAAYRRG